MAEQFAMLAPTPLTATPEVISWVAGYAAGTIFIGVLLGIIIFFLIRILNSFDKLAITVNNLVTAEAVTETKVDAHIENAALHCKGAGCLAIRERVA